MMDQQRTKLPYSCLAYSAPNDILFAVRGGQIISFPATGDSVLSYWTHPDQLPVSDLHESTAAKRSASELEDAFNAAAKRQKTEEPEVGAAEGNIEAGAKAGEGVETAQVQAQAQGEKKGKKKKEHVVKKERAVVTLLSVTEDGKHVIAVSGNDKTLWVFDHDGNGHLSENSKRVMPKRPCGIALAQNSQTIISADKFGDVYTLPLLATTAAPTGPTLTLAVKHKREHPAATPLTVHSAGNLRALEAQKRHMAERQKELSDAWGADAPMEPTFEHRLVLGHVSMLTDVVVVKDGKGREHIVTADRDEHIRVSRAPPHAYVIEGFCLGHKEFVSTLAVGGEDNSLLVSGGGDGEVFVWDWRKSQLVTTVDILDIARAQFNIEKIAVSRIIGTPETFFLICENLPTVFQLPISANTPSFATPITLPGAPLGLALVNGAPVVSVDGHGLVTLAQTNGQWSVNEGTFDDAAVDAQVPEVTEEEKKKLLYTVEGMRKKVMDFLADKEAQEAEEAIKLSQRVEHL